MLDSYVALLRGINVGGKNKLPMQDLITLCTEAGGIAVQTYIQSGNAVFQADAETAAGLPAKLSALIADHFGYRIPIVLRSASQLEAAVHGNPFCSKAPPKKLCTSCSSLICRAQNTLQALTLNAPFPTLSLCRDRKSTCICQTASKTQSSPTLILTQSSPPSVPAETGRQSQRCLA